VALDIVIVGCKTPEFKTIALQQTGRYMFDPHNVVCVAVLTEDDYY